jgi:signal transduction histidine kinase
MSDGAQLGFPDGPRSELERTIEELVERAQTVLQTQGRLRSLLQANRAVVEELDLEKVLRRIAEAAVSLVGAEYGALGVIAPDGHLERFLHVGMPDDAVERIGHLPEGHGILGAVIDQAAPIRLPHLGDDPRSAGFPARHPPMDAFLGVPIRVRHEVFGNLYLTNPRNGTFTAEDEELVTALAATAGIAIDNARLFDETRRRQSWSAALAEVTSALLSGNSDDVLGLIADRLATAVEADLVCVVVRGGEPGTLRVDTARGSDAEAVRGRVYPAEGTLVGRALASGQITSTDLQVRAETFEWQPGLGPTIAIPVMVVGEAIGALAIARATGGRRFGEAELSMAAEFASQTGLAIEIARARADRQSLELAEDRSRIARDLHDHVIQRLFGSGLALQSIAARNPSAAPELEAQVEAIDAAIAEIRTAVFALSRRRPGPATLRHRLLDVVSEFSGSLPSVPRVTFSGPVDLLIRGELGDDLVAAVREGLANVLRHADAGRVEVDVATVDGVASVEIVDDGVGIDPGVRRRSGTANLAARASAHGGSYLLEPAAGGGTRMRWTASLTTPTEQRT